MTDIRFRAAFFAAFCLTLLLAPFSIGMAMDEAALSHVIQLPESESVILVEKKTQSFMIYTAENDKWIKQLDVSCSTGEIGGGKVEAGDKKTPEGVYFLKDEYEDRYLTPVYGKKAFPIDYPNFLDRAEGKNGSAIWIHGTNKVLKPMDSNGCIALENENVVKISDYITLDVTPVIIVEAFDHQLNGAEKQNIRQKIAVLLEGWTKALESGTYHVFLSFYSPSYLPDVGYWQKLRKLSRQATESDLELNLRNDKVGIYLHKDIFTVLFEQRLHIDGKEYTLGRRKLYVADEKDGYRIVGDVRQTVPEELQTKQEPLVYLIEKILNPQMERERVVADVKSWLAAWSAKDMNTYASYYASEFYSDGMNKKQWVDRKKAISKQYSYINVKGSQFKIAELTDTGCEVSFVQIYESSGFTAKGIKRLQLVKKGGSWKISKESWKKK